MFTFVCYCLIALTFDTVQTTSPNSTNIPPYPVSVELSELRQQIREEHLTLREEMYSMLGGIMTTGQGGQGSLLDIVKELVGEVKYYQQLTLEQTREITQLETYRETTLEKLDEVRLSQESTLEKLDQLQGNYDAVLASVGELQASQELALQQTTSCSEQLPEITDTLNTLSSRMDTVRDEVRLISQHKLVWQNHTGTAYQPDFAVDGVYTRVDDINGHNPMSHSYITTRNNVLILDLGGLFKLHTVKVWTGISSSYMTRLIGVFVYADETLIGGIAESIPLHNFRVAGIVFARKIILRQTLAAYLDVNELQVFGSGPYGENEQ